MDEQKPGATIAPQADQPNASTQQEPPSQWQFRSEDAQAEAISQPAPRPADPTASFSWSGAEFIAHEKSAAWFGLFTLSAVGLAALVFVLTRDKVSTVIVLIVAAILGAYAGRKPRELEYKVDSKGISVGEKFYDYSQFKSFAIMDEGATTGLVLLPLRRFMPLLTVYFNRQDEDKIVDVLADQLPMEQHKPDLVDSFLQRIHF